jgi:hypothetical protein
LLQIGERLFQLLNFLAQLRVVAGNGGSLLRQQSWRARKQKWQNVSCYLPLHRILPRKTSGVRAGLTAGRRLFGIGGMIDGEPLDGFHLFGRE